MDDEPDLGRKAYARAEQPRRDVSFSCITPELSDPSVDRAYRV